MPLHDGPTMALPRLAPAPRSSLSDSVAEQLAQRIVDHELGPGARLPSERSMAEQLQVSRIVVREALGRLAQRGLVEVRPGVGAFVARMHASAVSDPLRLYIRRNRLGQAQLFELRHALEPAIAAAASRAASSDQRRALAANVARTEALAHELERALEATSGGPGRDRAGTGRTGRDGTGRYGTRRDFTSRDGSASDDALEAFAWSDLEFHRLLAAASGNPLFELLLEPLIDPLLEVRRAGARLPGAATRAAAKHRAIAQAVAEADAERAAQRMRAHLHEVEAWLKGLAPGASGTTRNADRSRPETPRETTAETTEETNADPTAETTPAVARQPEHEHEEAP